MSIKRVREALALRLAGPCCRPSRSRGFACFLLLALASCGCAAPQARAERTATTRRRSRTTEYMKCAN